MYLSPRLQHHNGTALVTLKAPNPLVLRHSLTNISDGQPQHQSKAELSEARKPEVTYTDENGTHQRKRSANLRRPQ